VVVSVKFTQILSGALGAAVYTCLAQRAGNYLIDPQSGAPDILQMVGRSPHWFDWATLSFLLLWNTKNLVDDYKAFEHPADQVFHPLLTIFFSAFSYTLLALAASTLFRGLLATQVLVAYFLNLAAWSSISWVRRFRSSDRSDIAVEKLWRRGGWALMYPLCALSIVLAIWWGSPLLFVVVVGAVYIFDCRNCRTFSSANPHGI
jgi:hypothetical protein